MGPQETDGLLSWTASTTQGRLWSSWHTKGSFCDSPSCQHFVGPRLRGDQLSHQQRRIKTLSFTSKTTSRTKRTSPNLSGKSASYHVGKVTPGKVPREGSRFPDSRVSVPGGVTVTGRRPSSTPDGLRDSASQRRHCPPSVVLQLHVRCRL